MTKREAAIVSAYTATLAGGMEAFQAYAEEKLGRPVWTHEFANKELWAELKAAAKPDFVSLTVEG